MHPSHECKNSCCRELGRERAGLPKQIWDRFPGQAGRKQGWGRGVGLRGAVLSLSSDPVTGALELPSVCLREAGPQHPVHTRTRPLPHGVSGTRVLRSPAVVPAGALQTPSSVPRCGPTLPFSERPAARARPLRMRCHARGRFFSKTGWSFLRIFVGELFGLQGEHT